MEYTYIIFLIGVITIVYASLSTLRTIDIKELIAYSSVSHAAVYLLGVFSNSIQGIEGAITLGIAHGFVSPGLFICAGGVLYDRSHTRVISFYRGVTQVMPLFAILFFILCLANCGAPLTLNFIGEFLSLYGVFERSSLYGLFASSSIIFSAAYTIYMFQRIAFGGAYSRMFTVIMPDLTKREFTILMLLAVPTVILGVYPAVILDGLSYGVSTLLYYSDIVSGSLSNTENFFSPTMTMLQSASDNSDEEERLLGDFENCRGPMDAGEPVDPDYEGDHTFTSATPETYEPSEGSATDAMCECCERTFSYATETLNTCITCDSSWCQTCYEVLENISNLT
jgi:formate hydrogenlyase subunit 3/multisubunit Na+/H+ antiporter MnhD subunit